MNSEKKIHQSRRAFIIFPPVGLILAHEGCSLGHKEMLEALGLSSERVSGIIETCPRGFYLSGNLCLYQGMGFSPLTDKNIKIALEYVPELTRALDMPDNTKIYSGMIVGKIGEHWTPMHLINHQTNERK